MRDAPGPITVVLAGDHTIVRQGLRKILEEDYGINVIGEAENGRQALELTLNLRPQIIVMDIAMPILTGLEAGREIRRRRCATGMVFMAMNKDQGPISEVMEMGASAYLGKETCVNELIYAIREVRRGNAFFSPAISKLVAARDRATRQASVGKPRILSGREFQVLRLIAEGRTNRQMGATLQIAVKTVEKHRAHIMNKLNIHDVAGLTRYAIGRGIIE